MIANRARSAPPAVPAGMLHVSSLVSWSSSVALNCPFASAVWPSATVNALPLVISGSASSSVIVALPLSFSTLPNNLAFHGSLSSNAKLSFSSFSSSSITATAIVRAVAPGPNVSVPLVPV